MRDEVGPFEFGDQEPISSHRKLLRAKAAVVSVAETPGQDFGRHGRERRAQVDGVTFEAIEGQGTEALLEQLRDELTGRTYQPLPARRQEIAKDGGKVRVLSI
jgi:hypothetical protein